MPTTLLIMGHLNVLVTPLLSLTTSVTKGNEFTFVVGVTVSSCFHEDLTAVAHDIQQRGDFFTQTGWSGLFG